jgi:lysophospholipase L1-like esterase
MGAELGGVARRATWLAAVAVIAGIVGVLQACLGTKEISSPPLEVRPALAPELRLAPAAALDSFYAALDALDRHQADHPVRVVQIGDSHTANDALSGRLRERFQGRFGAAGRGWLPAGIPFKYFHPNLVSVSETGWQHYRPSDHVAAIALGLDGVVAESRPPSSVMAIDSTEEGGFDKFAIEFLTRPNGSPFTVQVDNAAPMRVSTAAAETAIKRFVLTLEHPARRVELRTGGRPPVDLLGWSVERQHPGIIYENHGSIGARVDLLAQITPEAVSFELGVRQPALLIVAYGTNEGFADELDLDRYAARFHTAVVELQRGAPGASILVIGPPDGARVGHNCTPASCRPGGDARGDVREDAGGDDCAWHEPPKLAGVREVQRRVAAERGWAYWSWFQAMGGICSIDRMAAAEPPLAMADHVHLSHAGYEMIADLLFADLMREYEKWKAQPRGS